MARYINADRVKPDCMSTKGGVAISQSQLANQPNADVIERSKINKAINEIKEVSFKHCFELGQYIGEETVIWEVVKLDHILDILRRNIGE